MAAAAYYQKDDIPSGTGLLEKEMTRHPDDEALVTAATQAYFKRGLYSNALRVIERKLARTPDDAQWLYGKAIANMQMTNYASAVATFTHILQFQTNNPDALLNRAIAYLQNDQLNQSRSDYLQLQTDYTNSIQVAYGLGEIAWRQHATNESIRNYQIYLANAPTNSAETQTVRDRLNQLQHK